MKFMNPDYQLSIEDITKLESEIGIEIPLPLREQYLRSNGGSPEPYVFENEDVDTVVAEMLPLKSKYGRGTAIKAYRNLVINKKIVPQHFFPFAVDGGGDYFFVDCSSTDSPVYFFRGEFWPDEKNRCLVNLAVNIDEFWTCLKAEEE